MASNEQQAGCACRALRLMHLSASAMGCVVYYLLLALMFRCKQPASGTTSLMAGLSSTQNTFLTAV